MQERWTNLIYGGKKYDQFLISSTGRMKNVNTGTIYAQSISTSGYCTVNVTLGSRKSKKMFKIHKAVAESFVKNPEGKPVVNHIDGNKRNNNIENLEWVTYSENTLHAYKTGLMKHPSGEDNPMAALSQEQADWIRKHYIPYDREFGSRALGRKFGISHMNVLNIVKGFSYKRNFP